MRFFFFPFISLVFLSFAFFFVSPNFCCRFCFVSLGRGRPTVADARRTKTKRNGKQKQERQRERKQKPNAKWLTLSLAAANLGSDLESREIPSRLSTRSNRIGADGIWCEIETRWFFLFISLQFFVLSRSNFFGRRFSCNPRRILSAVSLALFYLFFFARGFPFFTILHRRVNVFFIDFCCCSSRNNDNNKRKRKWAAAILKRKTGNRNHRFHLELLGLFFRRKKIKRFFLLD